MKILGDIFAFFVGLFGVFVAMAGIIVVMGLLWAIPTMLLWDWLMPELFGLSTITIWQAWGINMLSGILFKSKSKSKETKSKDKTKKNLF